MFPWPLDSYGNVIPTVFVPCSAEEDMGGQSKSNTGQVDLTAAICTMLRTPRPDQANGNADVADAGFEPLAITVLTPYSKQVKELRNKLPQDIPASTIDAFQGRESDIIIYTTVRCNVSKDLGFVDDERRLNVAWTRARKGLIIVGDRATLSDASQLWSRAIQSCSSVPLSIPTAA